MAATSATRLAPRTAEHEIAHDVADRLDRVLDANSGDRREGVAHRFQQRGFLRHRAAARIGQRGDVGVRRAGEGAGREHQHEIDAEILPLDGAQVGDAGLDVAAEHVDHNRVADLELEARRRSSSRTRPAAAPGSPHSTRLPSTTVEPRGTSVAKVMPRSLCSTQAAFGGALMSSALMPLADMMRPAQHRDALEHRPAARCVARRRRSGRSQPTGCRRNRTTAPCRAARPRTAAADCRRSQSP